MHWALTAPKSPSCHALHCAYRVDGQVWLCPTRLALALSGGQSAEVQREVAAGFVVVETNFRVGAAFCILRARPPDLCLQGRALQESGILSVHLLSVPAYQQCSMRLCEVSAFNRQPATSCSSGVETPQGVSTHLASSLCNGSGLPQPHGHATPPTKTRPVMLVSCLTPKSGAAKPRTTIKH